MTSISILGIYVADLVFFADKIPTHGESVLGQEHVIGPGGKGSNQSVAVSKAGGKVNFISKIGNDPYGEMALEIYQDKLSRQKITLTMSCGCLSYFENRMLY